MGALRALLYFIFVISYIFIGISTATIKTWYPNTNFWNPENWDLKRPPCRSDLVQFPAAAEVAVSLHPGDTAMREIILPINGELVLAEGQLLVTGLSGTTSAGCPGEDLVFTGGEERAWLDSRNWRDADGNDWPGGEDSPVPHAERIPCPTDQVVFPEGSTFKVRLPDIPVTVGSLSVQGQSTTATTFQRMVQITDTGAHLFKGDANSLQVSGNVCSDPRGCVCVADQFSNVMELLCVVEKRRCKVPPPCENPIQPVGHCCEICGAVIKLKIDLQLFSTSKILAKLQKNYPQLLFHLRRLDNDRQQIILREKGIYSGRSAIAADKLAEELRNDPTMGVVSALINAAGEPLTNLGSTWSIVLFTLLLIVLLLGSAYLASYGYQRYRSGATFPAIFPKVEMPSFHFRRFENRSASVDGEVEITKAEESMGESERDVKAFDNPMFDNPASSASTSGINVSGGLLARPKAAGRSMTVENPTYRALQAAAQRDLLEEEPEEAEEVDITPQFASSKYTSLHEEE